MRYHRGDTIIEVILAFGIFAMLAIGATVVMNRGLSMGQQSLERTLVRQQVDAQAELLRYARDTDSSAWSSILSNNLVSNPNTSQFTECPEQAPNRAFIMNILETTGDINKMTLGTVNYEPADYYSRAQLRIPAFTGSMAFAHGIWIQAIRVEGTPADAGDVYDMYIRACWYGPGSPVPMQVSTIVRLYEN